MTSAVPIGAGFLPRLLAYIIDGFVLAVPSFLLTLLLPQFVAWIAQLAIGVAYVVYFWTSSGSTLGKMAMNLKVVSAETGELVDPGTAVLRYVGYFVSGIALGLGFLWIIFDDNKEGWHDKIAKTRVIKTS